MKTLLLITLFLSFSVVSFGQTITSTTTNDKTTVKTGEVTTLTTSLKNTSTVVPIVLTASLTYTDSLGVEQTVVSAPVTLNVIHPAVATKITVAIPTTATYVASSAKVDGVSVTPTIANSFLTIPFSKTLNDQDTCVILYQFQAK